MVTFHRNCALCLLALGMLFQTVLQVAGINCYECENCGFYERGWETDCNRKVNPNLGLVPNACSKVFEYEGRIHRKCAFVENQYKFHSCERTERGEECFCGTYLCNSAQMSTSFFTLISTLSLITLALARILAS